MMAEYTDVIATVPPGVLGEAQVLHDEPSPIERMRSAWKGMSLSRDKYARLIVGRTLMMTDAEFERRSNRFLFTHAKGDCLVAGLGLGLILHPLLAQCNSVTVVEKSADVIGLVGPRYPQCTLIRADILEWLPARKYDTIYFDIWPDVCGDDLAEATKLHRRFRKYLNADGWIGSWTREANRLFGRRR